MSLLASLHSCSSTLNPSLSSLAFSNRSQSGCCSCLLSIVHFCTSGAAFAALPHRSGLSPARTRSRTRWSTETCVGAARRIGDGTRKCNLRRAMRDTIVCDLPVPGGCGSERAGQPAIDRTAFGTLKRTAQRTPWMRLSLSPSAMAIAFVWLALSPRSGSPGRTIGSSRLYRSIHELTSWFCRRRSLLSGSATAAFCSAARGRWAGGCGADAGTIASRSSVPCSAHSRRVGTTPLRTKACWTAATCVALCARCRAGSR